MKQNRFVLTFFLLSLLLLTSACQPAATPPPQPTVSPLTGTLSELQGKVDGKKSGEAQFAPVVNGTILNVSDQVQTGEDGRVRIDLSSGTIIRVVPSSLFTLVSNEETSDGLASKSKLDLGRIFVVLKGGSMDVETPSGVASVRGSYVMVFVDPQSLDTLITCLEGECSADNAAGSADFTDGQKTVLFHGGSTAPEVENMTEQDYEDWRDNNQELDTFIASIQENNEEPPTAPPELVTVVPPTATPAGSAVCLTIIQPEDDASLSFNGAVNFQWEPRAGASQYTVTFHYPGGQTQAFTTSDTQLTRYMDTLTDGGSYQWDIAALDGSGSMICATPGSSFSKPSSHPQDIAPPSQEPEEPPLECEEGQWEDATAPCYCDPTTTVNPSYCGQPPAFSYATQ
jgi:hypothetical protein